MPSLHRFQPDMAIARGALSSRGMEGMGDSRVMVITPISSTTTMLAAVMEDTTNALQIPTSNSLLATAKGRRGMEEEAMEQVCLTVSKLSLPLSCLLHELII